LIRRPSVDLRAHRVPRRRNGFERLEVRQLLSAAPWMGPPDPMSMGAWTKPEMPIARGDAVRADHSAFLGPAGGISADPYSAKPSIPPPQAVVLPTPMFKEARAQDESQPPEPARERAVLIESTDETFPAGPAMADGRDPAPSEILVVIPLASPAIVQNAAAARLTSSDPAPPAPGTFGVSDLPPDSGYVDARAANSSTDSMMAVIIESWQPTDFGQMGGADEAPPDMRFRAVEVTHEVMVDPRMGMPLVDGSRAPGANGFAGEEGANQAHHLPTYLFAMVGQAAAEGAVSIAGGPAFGDVHRGFVASGGEGDPSDESLSERTAVGYLVAFDEMITTLGIGALGFAERPGETVDAGVPLLHDLLTPQFTCDAAALSVAIDEIAAQAEELGVGLLGMFADPVALGEAALVAGVVGAGLAYRHWRGGRRQGKDEEQELLSARFIRGHASLRLANRIHA
jgi:hypothetical protein